MLFFMFYVCSGATPLSNLDGIELVAEVSTRREGAQSGLLGQKAGQIAVAGSGGR